MATVTGTEMRYRPLDNYANMQNPPDFSWPWEEGAVSYDLVICRDRQMQAVAYQKLDHPVNYYNFPFTFEPGVYYWHARWKRKGKWGPGLIPGDSSSGQMPVLSRFRMWIPSCPGFRLPIPEFMWTEGILTDSASVSGRQKTGISR